MPRRSRRSAPMRPEVPLDCRAGQLYLVKRHRRPALTVKIVEVHTNMTSDGPQPKAWYVALTKNGTPRRKAARWERKRAVAWLTFRDGAWRFPHGDRIDNA